jgi:hypothetical protein
MDNIQPRLPALLPFWVREPISGEEFYVPTLLRRIESVMGGNPKNALAYCLDMGLYEPFTPPNPTFFQPTRFVCTNTWATPKIRHTKLGEE